MNDKLKILKDRRKEKGLSQKDLAFKVEVSYQYIGRIERGEINIGLELMEKLADALDCELRLLLK